MENHYFQLWCR